MSEVLIDYDAAAVFLGIAKGTLYALVSQKRVPHVRLGKRLVRFSEPDLRNWIAERRIPQLNEARR
ncbi:MAG: helix-turn-helix domain-containing protein [Pseudomonadota bacterium]